VWPGIKTIKGCKAQDGDPEFNISNGKLLPNHIILSDEEVSTETKQKLQDSLVMVHGGMAQDVGPILEMVTEKYLLRSEKEWKARQKALNYFDQIVAQLKIGDIKKLGELTQNNFDGPIQYIIPWATTAYTEKIIEKTKAEFGDNFWGFWMMGGMSGGGMGFMFAPEIKKQAQDWLLATMLQIKKEMETAVPFAMDPVVYDFKINEKGTFASLTTGETALLPVKYYTLLLPRLLKKELNELTRCKRSELQVLAKSQKMKGSYNLFVSGLFDRMIPDLKVGGQQNQELNELLENHGFNAGLHETIKTALKSGQIGLAQNRLRTGIKITDSKADEINYAEPLQNEKHFETGKKALQNGELAIVTLAGGVGSRWTKGAGVVKSLHPFCKFAGKHRNFIELHLAKNKKTAKKYNAFLPHVFTTSYLTHEPIKEFLNSNGSLNNGYVFLSP
ncbi:MAG: UTP--glucose-1-phosphate uridylyltransferase, partial [Bacteroidales bacterium]|nr:UTP--glucose-1-phosphate uridylyltransferase [Bacteroidales bacterium]